MTIRRDATGKRWIEVEAEMPGTPEEVWRAIATGEGITCWFTRAEVEERAGGTATFYMGGGASKAEVTAWEPGRVFAAESPDGAPGGPPLANEFHVETRAGGTCVVRIVNSLFSDRDDWDNHLESMEKGWAVYFEVLRVYLRGFAGQKGALVESMGMAEGPLERAYAELAGALGVAGAAAGDRVASAPGVPRFEGTVEKTIENGLVVVSDVPAPGVLLIGAYDCGGPAMPMVNLYFYGDAAAETARGEESPWREWMASRFPMPATPPEAAADAVATPA